LESRLSPSSVGALPENLTLSVTYLPNKQVTLSGQLTGTSTPGGECINLMGAVEGTAVTNAQGYYSVTLTAQSLGQVSAATADGLSNTATAMLVSAASTLSNFVATQEGPGLWLFTGNVNGAPTQGMMINFAGLQSMQGQSISVNPDGSFAFYFQVPAGQNGIVSAQAIDWWGDTSNTAMVYAG
jgi:hypothetical protein